MQIVKYLPLIVSGWHIFSCIVSYIIAVRKKHVYYMFPYISDAGAMTPESNIFGQCLNIGAAVMAIGLYIRFRQIDYDVRTKNITLNPLWNKLGIIVGYLASFGVSIVGNFPEVSVISIHIVGALMAFGFSILYLYVQTWISSYYIKARYRKISRLMFYTRLSLACTLLPLLISLMVFGYFAIHRFNGKSLLWWTEEDGGYNYRLASVFSEWFLFLFLFIYIATFSGEFQNIEFVGITFKYKQQSKN